MYRGTYPERQSSSEVHNAESALREYLCKYIYIYIFYVGYCPHNENKHKHLKQKWVPGENSQTLFSFSITIRSSGKCASRVLHLIEVLTGLDKTCHGHTSAWITG